MTESSDSEGEGVNNRAYNYQCSHVCGCTLSTPHGNRKSPFTFNNWASCNQHLRSQNRHEDCSIFCPAYRFFGNPRLMVQEDHRIDGLRPRPRIKREPSTDSVVLLDTPPRRSRRISNTIARNINCKAGPLRSPSLPSSSSSSSDEGKNERLIAYKCSHTCRCLGKSGHGNPQREERIFCGKSEFFRFSAWAKRHISAKDRHPLCSPQCRAYSWINRDHKAKVIAVEIDKSGNEYGMVEKEGCIPVKKRPAEVEEPPVRVVKKTRLGVTTPVVPPRIRPNAVASTSRPLPTTHGLPTASDSSASSSRLHHNNSSSKDHVLRHLEGLGISYQDIAPIPSRLHVLSLGLHMLAYTTPTNLHFSLVDENATPVSTKVLTTSLMDKVRHLMIPPLEKVISNLTDLAQSESTHSDLRYKGLRDLRRRVAILQDGLRDLALDLKRLGDTGKLKEGGATVKDPILNLSKEVSDIGDVMKEMMVTSLTHLSTM